MATHSSHPTFGAAVKKLGDGAGGRSPARRCGSSSWFQIGPAGDGACSAANRFLEMMSELTGRLAPARGTAPGRRRGSEEGGRDHPDLAFYTGEIAAAKYFACTVLPGVEEEARHLADEDNTALDIPDAAFATV